MRVRPDFVPKIMHALSVSASPSTVLRFVRLAKPPLTDQASIETYVGALCDNNIVDALLYVRHFPESNDETAQRARLTGMILNSCLIRECGDLRFCIVILPAHSGTMLNLARPRPDALNTLLSFPLTAYEQILLNTYALRPPPSLPESSLAILQDLIIVRFIHQGKYSDAIALDKLFVSAAASTGRTGSGGGAVVNASESRRETFQEILAVLPDIQRRLLDVSLNEHQARAPTASQPSPTNNDAPPPADLTVSWEELGRSTYTLASSITPTQVPRASNNGVVPQTPLSASVAFRTATNPRVAVLRAFTQATPSGPLGPANAGASFGAKLEGSPAPGARLSSYLAQSTASRFDASTTGVPPLSPFNVTSPFASRPRLAYTPSHRQIQPPKFGPSTSDTTRWHRLQPSSFFLSGESGSPSRSPAPATSRNGNANRSSVSHNKGPTTTGASSRVSSSIPANIPSLFGLQKAVVPPPPPRPDDNTVDPDRIFKPSRTLLRTPFLPSVAQQRTKPASLFLASTTIPPLPQQPGRLFGQSTSTPTKKRGREEMQDLWGGNGNASEQIDFIVSSDDEQSPLRPQRVRPRLYSPDISSVIEQHSSFVEVERQLVGVNDTTMEDAEIGMQDELSRALQDSQDAADDEEAEAELLRVGSASELPGAFPEDVPVRRTEQVSEHSLRHRTRKPDFENRQALSSWMGTNEPELNESESETKPAKGRTSSTAKTKPSTGKTSARKTSSRRSTRARSVVSDAPTEETEPDQEAVVTAAPVTTRSSALRRSSRLSATSAPSEAQGQPRTRKSRAPSSPVRDGKRKAKSRSSSSGPPPSGSSRLTRRQAPVLESLEE